MRDHLRNRINGDVKWDGSCHGIATVMGRVFNQDMTIAEVSDSGRSCIYDLDPPNEDTEYLSAISYYQLMQYVDDPGVYELASVFHKRPGMVGSILDFLKGTDSAEKSTPEEFEKFFETMRSVLDKGKVLILRCPSHTVLVTGYETTESGYSFQIYDENSVNNKHPEGEFYEWKVSRNFVEFSCDGFFTHDGDPFNEETFGWLSILLPSDTDQGQMAEPKKDVADILIDAMDRFTIRDSKGRTLESDGKEKMEATMEVEDLQMINDSLGDETQSSLDCKFTVADAGTYEISNLEDSTEISLYNDEGYLSLQGTGLTSAKLTPGEGFEIQGEDGASFTAVLDTDEKVAENETGLISLSGTLDGSGSVVIQTSGDTVTLTAENSVKDLQGESYVKNEAYPLQIGNIEGNALEAGKETQVKATDFAEEDDGEDPVVPGDEDPDGGDDKNNGNNGNPETDGQNSKDKDPADEGPETGDSPVGGYVLAVLLSGGCILGVLSRRRKSR